MLSCCFTGHRTMDAAEQELILSILTEQITELIKKGVTVFRNGGALGFDIFAALCVLSLKYEYPDIKLYIDAPHRAQAIHWDKDDKRVYEYILSRADKVTYVSDHYSSGCMLKRNRYMVDRSEYVIAYIRKQHGGSYYTARYAEKKGRQVIYV